MSAQKHVNNTTRSMPTTFRSPTRASIHHHGNATLSRHSSSGGPSSLGCFLENTKSIFHSPYLKISMLAIWLMQEGIYKTLIWGVPFGVIISMLASGVRLWLAPAPPPQALPTWKQSQRLLQFKLVDTFLQLNVSFRRRNGSQSARQQLRETLLLDGDAWCLSEIHENNTFPSCRGNLEKKKAWVYDFSHTELINELIIIEL